MNRGSNKLRPANLVFRSFSLVAIAILWPLPLLMGQTPVKSSAEVRLRRIEEHQQIRRATLELTQDLRAIHLTPEQRQEIRQLLKRYHMTTGTSRRNPDSEPPATEAAQPTPEDSTSATTRPPVAQRLRTEVAALLTSEQSDRLNAIKQEREERAQKNPDFQIRKNP